MSRSCDESYDVYDERRVRARKAHRCGACRETIAAGHYYMRVGVVYDGSASAIRRCLRCQALHVHLRKRCHDMAADERNRYGYSGDTMWPDEELNCGLAYEDEWGDLPDEIAALAFMTGADMQEAES